MIDETNESNVQPRSEPTEQRTAGDRAAVAKRVALHRARKAKLEGRDLVLSEKQALKQRHKTEALFADTLARLTPEERQALEIGADDFPNLRELNDQMFKVVHLVDLECFDHQLCRPDLIVEFRDSFVKKFPYARDLIFPKVWFADGDYRSGFAVHGGDLYAIRDKDGKNTLVEFDEDSAIQFPMERFEEALQKFKRWRSKNSAVEPVDKQKRKRRTETAVTLKPEALVDPAVVKDWSTAPARPQSEVWSEHAADLAAHAIERDVEAALFLKPPAFEDM